MEKLELDKLETENSTNKSIKIRHYSNIEDGRSGYLLFESENLVTKEFTKIEGDPKDGYRKTEYSNKSDLAIEKQFFPNGSLRLVSQCYIGFPNPHKDIIKTRNTNPAFYIGLFREYDKRGKLIKEIDNEEHFKFTLDNVKNLLLEKYKIDFSGPGKFAGISRSVSSESSIGYWRLDIPKDSLQKREKGLMVILDGTGNIIEEREYTVHY